ncbi:MAG TPA: serine/threonine-protein kinase [Acidimicrobiales bacterium]|nr:serine/threonine-protein kinase [Acidimicrobiales bacterium]
MATPPDRPLIAGRYALGGPLGAGGMGEVLAGDDVVLGRPVAVKVLRPEMAGRPDVRTRFTNEARLAARLNHPGVVAVYDTGVVDDRPYIVMERLSGRTLGDVIDAGPMPAADVRAMALQVLDALEAAHRMGVLHRDVKPSNILDAGPGRWKVADFGVAKADEATDPSLTATGLVVGTAAYLSPERLAGHPADASSDLYALGVVCREALLGQRSAGRGALVPDRTPLADAGVPADLAAVVDRATSADAATRYRSAAAMAEALRHGGGATATTALAGAAGATTAAVPVVSGPPTEVLRPTTVRPAALTQPLGPPPRRVAPPVADRPAPPWRRPLLALLASLAVVVVILVVVALAGGGGGSTGATTSTSTTAPPATSSTSPPTTAPATTAATTTTTSASTTTVPATTVPTTTTTVPTTTSSSTTSASTTTTSTTVAPIPTT